MANAEQLNANLRPRVAQLSCELGVARAGAIPGNSEATRKTQPPAMTTTLLVCQPTCVCPGLGSLPKRRRQGVRNNSAIEVVVVALIPKIPQAEVAG